MKNKINSDLFIDGVKHYENLFETVKSEYQDISFEINKRILVRESINELAEVLFITSYPPRECGIATYSQDLIKALNNKFSNSLSIKVCALESGDANYPYPTEVKYILNTSLAAGYEKLALTINKDNRIKIVLIQHEFGFFNMQE